MNDPLYIPTDNRGVIAVTTTREAALAAIRLHRNLYPYDEGMGRVSPAWIDQDWSHYSSPPELDCERLYRREQAAAVYRRAREWVVCAVNHNLCTRCGKPATGYPWRCGEHVTEWAWDHGSYSHLYDMEARMLGQHVNNDVWRA